MPILTLAAMTAMSCSPDPGPPASSAYTVQIVDAFPAPTKIRCGGLATPFLILVNVYMANSTSSPVTLLRASSSAQYISPEALFGKNLLVSESLPFTPLYLRAHDGSNYSTVSISGTCPPPNGYGKFYLTVFMTTDSGQYATKPMLLSLEN